MKQLKSIRYPFAIDRELGTLMEEHDFSRHVKQLMLQVLFTNPGERINRPDFGCGLRKMVFAPNSVTTGSMLQILITEALDRWLGDVITTDKIEVTVINEKLNVNISYYLKTKKDREFLNTII